MQYKPLQNGQTTYFFDSVFIMRDPFSSKSKSKVSEQPRH